MLRWILLAVALAAFGFVFTTHSPTVLGIALLVGVVTLLWSLGAFLAARVDSVAQGQGSREVQLLMSARKGAPARPGAPQPGRRADGSSDVIPVDGGGGGRGRSRADDDAREGNDGGSDAGGGDGGGGGGGD
jgi:hypothetical protein